MVVGFSCIMLEKKMIYRYIIFWQTIVHDSSLFYHDRMNILISNIWILEYTSNMTLRSYIKPHILILTYVLGSSLTLQCRWSCRDHTYHSIYLIMILKDFFEQNHWGWGSRWSITLVSGSHVIVGIWFSKGQQDVHKVLSNYSTNINIILLVYLQLTISP